jgi:hypothetical protein
MATDYMRQFKEAYQKRKADQAEEDANEKAN